MRLLLLTVFALVLSACASSKDSVLREDMAFKAFTVEEGERFNKLDDTAIKALVANGYKAVGSRHRVALDGGTEGSVVFVKCGPGQNLQECGKAEPTAERPHFQSTGWWSGDYASVRFRPQSSAWEIRSNGFVLLCGAEFPMNSYSVAQVPEALRKFVTPGGKPFSEKKEMSFPSNPDPNGPPSMGTVTWHCAVIE